MIKNHFHVNDFFYITQHGLLRDLSLFFGLYFSKNSNCLEFKAPRRFERISSTASS
jgi:hypothetical protein